MPSRMNLLTSAVLLTDLSPRASVQCEAGAHDTTPDLILGIHLCIPDCQAQTLKIQTASRAVLTWRQPTRQLNHVSAILNVPPILPTCAYLPSASGNPLLACSACVDCCCVLPLPPRCWAA